MGYMEINVDKPATKDSASAGTASEARSETTKGTRHQPPTSADARGGSATKDAAASASVISAHGNSNSNSEGEGEGEVDEDGDGPIDQDKAYSVLQSIQENSAYPSGPDSAVGSESAMAHIDETAQHRSASSAASKSGASTGSDAAASASGKRQYLNKPIMTQKARKEPLHATERIARETQADSRPASNEKEASRDSARESPAAATASVGGVPRAATQSSPVSTPASEEQPRSKASCSASSAPGTASLAKSANTSPGNNADPLHSLDDLDGASSMFTTTDLDEADAYAQKQVLAGNSSPSPSEKAALLEKARLEIEGLDEHEGVGLLDQTPELSYRVAGQMNKATFDAKKRRARSSSNTVVRVLSEIVRDSTGAASRGTRHIPGFSTIAHHRSTKSSSPHGRQQSSQQSPSKTIQRHSSTGAINQSGNAVDDLGGSVRPGAAADLLAGAAGVDVSGRPDILRSHSHNTGQQFRGLALPERIAEVPEPPTPRDLQSENALRIELDASESKSSADARPVGSGYDKERAGAGNTSSRQREAAVVGFKLDSVASSLPAMDANSGASGSGEPIHAIAAPPPRADEYLKPVFLKGLFSVSTTSTRSPTAIRDNLLKVLSGMPLRFHEGKGYFTCSMITASGPTNLQEGALDAYAHEEQAASKNSGIHKHKKSLRLPGVDRKISFRRRPKQADEPFSLLTASGSRAGGAAGDSIASTDDVQLGSGHSVAESAGDGAQDGRQAPITTVTNANSNAICFQIFLVRMPLLGLCGLQFRRVSGPAWKYKDICSDILKRLKL
ncbi:Serine/threonine-protein kinase [Coemansia sp. RSA 2599]|nr:Serine/threonine-protein kinase [Coemansia sp. RSA 2599]